MPDAQVIQMFAHYCTQCRRGIRKTHEAVMVNSPRGGQDPMCVNCVFDVGPPDDDTDNPQRCG